MGGWHDVSVDGRRMRAYVAAPDGGGVSPAVVVIHHGWGVDEVIESVVDRLANVAYVAIAPDLFHRQEPRDEDVMKRIGALRDAEVVSDIRSSLAHLGALPGRRIAYGFAALACVAIGIGLRVLHSETSYYPGIDWATSDELFAWTFLGLPALGALNVAVGARLLLTVSVALALVTVPALFETITRKLAPLSPAAAVNV